MPDPCPVVPDPSQETDFVTATIEVIDPGGAFVKGAQIRLLPTTSSPAELKTGDLGEVSVKLIPGTYHLHAAMPFFLPSAESIYVQRQSTQTFRVTLRPDLTPKIIFNGGPNPPLQINQTAPAPVPVAVAPTITVTVTNLRGTPTPYAQIGGLRTEGFPEVDEVGKFSLKLFPGDYDLVVTSPSYLNWAKHIQIQDRDSRSIHVLLTRAADPN